MEKAKLFKNGHSQAVRLPREYRLSGTEVYIKKIGNMVILIPVDDPWQPLFASLAKFPKDFMEDRAQPPQQEREDFF